MTETAANGRAAPAIRFEGIVKVFGDPARGGTVAVDRVDLAVAPGEFFSMLGPSGSGKTTMLRMAAGFEEPTAGRILLDGVDVTASPPFDRNVNTVFQDYALFPHMTVAENVGYGLKVKRVGRVERTERVAQSLEQVRLATFGDRKPGQLSGGQRQRVALARALVNRPRLLLLDEPLGALDLKLREEMQVELKAIQRQVDITFVFVTHDQDEALSMSDRIAVFNNGRIEQVGTPADLYERPATAFVAGFVGTSNLLTGAHAVRLVGRAGTFTIRPEQIRLLPAGAAAGPHERTADGVVAEIQYLGSQTRYRVAIGDDAHLVVTRPNTVPDGALRRGEAVRLGFRHDHAVALSGEPAIDDPRSSPAAPPA